MERGGCKGAGMASRFVTDHSPENILVEIA